MMKHMHVMTLRSLMAGAAGMILFATGVFSQEPGVADPDAAGAQGLAPSFISPEELKQLIDAGSDKILLVDNAPAMAFEEEHIPGAVNFPWVQAIKPPVTLPRNKTLVLYCPCGPGDADSVDMSNKLRRFGYFNTKVLDGGYFKWLELGYPVASKEKED